MLPVEESSGHNGQDPKFGHPCKSRIARHNCISGVTAARRRPDVSAVASPVCRCFASADEASRKLAVARNSGHPRTALPKMAECPPHLLF